MAVGSVADTLKKNALQEVCDLDFELTAAMKASCDTPDDHADFRKAMQKAKIYCTIAEIGRALDQSRAEVREQSRRPLR